MRGRFLALLIVLMVAALGLAATALAQEPECPPPSCQCPEGTVLVAKFEWNGTAYIFEKPEGNEDVVTIVGDETGGTWSSMGSVTAVAMKGGRKCHIYNYSPAATSGIFSKQDFPMFGEELACKPDISTLRFCKEKEETAVQLKDFTASASSSARSTNMPWLAILLGLIVVVGGFALMLTRQRR